ncbi:MAG: hypothetical protein IJW07_04675, partial [Lentisphaeria bacterium]|nr:hypothetical protein [Lentisphaeria bacterium]
MAEFFGFTALPPFSVQGEYTALYPAFQVCGKRFVKKIRRAILYAYKIQERFMQKFWGAFAMILA